MVKKIYLMLLLVLLSACAKPSDLCFKIDETPKLVTTYHQDRTEHELVGDNLTILLTRCPRDVGVDQQECKFDGKTIGVCSASSTCVVMQEKGKPVAYCQPKDI